MQTDTDGHFIPQALINRWRLWTIGASVTPLVFAVSLSFSWPRASSVRFLLLTYTVIGYQIVFLRRNLFHNRPAEESTILPRFGPGNLATMIRGLMLAIMAGFLFSPRPTGWQAWLPAILYTASDITDYLDGYLARRSGHVTQLGERLDLEWDAFGLAAATTLAIWYGVLPWFFLPIGLARYAFSFGLWVREKRSKPVYELAPSRSRRPIAGLTMGYMSAMLWPIIPSPAGAIAGGIFLLPFAASFGRDWLVVSGRLDPSTKWYMRWRNRLRVLLLDTAPIFIRICLVLALGVRLRQKMIDIDLVVRQFAASGFPMPHFIVSAFNLIEVVGLLAILVGLAGRFASLMLIFPIGFTIIASGQDLLSTILLTTNLLILILGTGGLSLWKPTDTIFTRRAGEGLS